MTTPTPPGGNFPSGNLSNTGYGSPAAGGLLGTNNLQQSVDSNTRAISNLASAMSRILGGGGGSRAGTGSGVPWVSPSLAGMAATRFPPVFNPFSMPQGPTSPYPQQGSVPWVSPYLGSRMGPQPFPGVINNIPLRNFGNPVGPYSRTGAYGGGQVTWNANQGPQVINPFINQYGQPPVVGPTAQRLPSGQVVSSQGPPTPPPMGPNGYMGSLPPQPQGFLRRNAMMIGGVLGSVAGASILFGRSMLSDQVAANLYTSMATTAAPLGSNPNAINSLARYQAFGAAGQNLNSVAFNTQDAASGAASLGYIGGYVPGMNMGANGRTVNNAFNAIGLANPTLGASQSSALTGTLYSQNVALRMQMLGYRTTPRSINGGWNSPASVVQGFLQRWYGSNSVNQKSLISTLSAGGIGTYNLQAAGFNPQQISQVTPLIETYNKLFNAGLSADQAQGLINRSTRGSQSSMLQAQDELASRYGIQKSDLQALKDRQSVITGNRSDIANGFNSALQESVKLLGDFNQVLNNMMRATGTSGLFGGFAGVGGAASTITHGGIMGLGVGLGMRLLGRGGAGALLGGGAGAAGAGAGAAGATGTAAGGGAAASAMPGWLAGILGGGAAAVGAAGATAGGVGLLLNALRIRGGLLGGTNLNRDPGYTARFGPMTQNVGGGAGGSPSSSSRTRQTPGKGNQQVGGGSVSAQAKAAVNAAETRLGDPYVFGADGPNAFDCSGLVEWAYAQAGVQIPRTSESQWFGLRDRRIALKNVQEGDIVFGIGSDGSANSPGHEAMMINQRQIVEAPHTGASVSIRAFNPNEWIGAARPRGSVAGQGGPVGGGPGGPGSGNTGLKGNTGMGGLMGTSVGFGATEATTLGSAMSESEMLAGGGAPGVGGMGGGTTATNAGGTPAKGGGTPGVGGISGGGNISQNKALMQKLATAYGWGSGPQWSALNWLVMAESGYNNHIWEGGSTGRNPGPGSSKAYGIAQALPASKYPKAGQPEIMGGQSDPKSQEVWMLNYVRGRYQTPAGAKAFHIAHNWYGSGGHMGPGEVGVVGDRGPELIQAGRDGATVMSAARTSELLSGMNNITQQMGSLNTGRSHAKSNVTLNFGPGSVVLSTLSGNYNDSANAARVFIRKLRKELENEHVYMVIAEGGKN